MADQVEMMERPAMPEWFVEAERSMAEDNTSSYDMPRHLQSLYNLFSNVGYGDCSAAETIAIKYETGEMPGGLDLVLALTWHRYAVARGSSSSALRLAQLLEWTPVLEHADNEAVKMAHRALEI